jgi:hypothetical protein
MKLAAFYPGEDLNLEIAISDENGEAVTWEELSAIEIVLKANQKPLITLSKADETIAEGSAIGKVLIGVDKAVTATWPKLTKLSAEIIVTIDGQQSIAKADLFNIQNTEKATSLL